MRGLPPPPPDVVLVESVWTMSGVKNVSTSWYVFAPGASVADFTQLNTLLGDFFLGPIADLLAVLPTDVTCSVLRLTAYGPEPLVVQFEPSPNVGAIGTSNPANGAAVLTWRTGNPRSSSLGHTFLPLSDTFVDSDHSTLRPISWSQLQSTADFFRQSVNSIASPDGGLCVLVVLTRSSAGVPLHASLMTPVQRGDASRFVGTLRRRVRPDGR